MERDFADEPLVEARLRHTLVCHSGTWETHEGIDTHFTGTHSIRGSSGPDHPDALESTSTWPMPAPPSATAGGIAGLRPQETLARRTDRLSQHIDTLRSRLALATSYPI